MTKKASEKRKTFNREFREARAAFRINPTEKNFTFTSKVDGGKKTVLKEGETKQGLMKKFKAEFNSAAPTKTTDSTPGFLKRKAAGTRIVKNTKLADVTKQELNAWKEKNKGLYKGKALTAYLNAKGKNLSKPKTVARATEKVGSGKDYETYPEKIAGISRSDMLKIIDSSKNPVKSKTVSASNRREEAPTVKLQRRIEGARSAAEVREIVNNSGIKIPAAKMTVLLGKLEKAGLFNFKPAKPKPSPKVEKSKPTVKKPNRITTKSRKMSNAAVVKLFKEMYPSRLANIKIGDIVYFDPNRTNKQDNPAIVMIKSKGK